MVYRHGTPPNVRTVRVGHKIYENAVSPTSFSSMEDNANALAVMRELDSLDRLDAVDFAAIDRLNGLVLCISEPLPTDQYTTWFFGHLVAGYDGTAQRFAASVLHLFGFGEVSDIHLRITRGSMSAYHEFTK